MSANDRADEHAMESRRILAVFAANHPDEYDLAVAFTHALLAVEARLEAILLEIDMVGEPPR